MENDLFSLAGLKNLAEDIPEPNNFFKGLDIRTSIHPNNAICFARRDLVSNNDIFQHHHCVLLVALTGAGRVCIEDKNVFLEPGEALLVFPFQFHSYTQMPKDGLFWFFIQFDIPSTQELQSLQYAPVVLGEIELILLRETILCWKTEKRRHLFGAHLNLLLSRLSVAKRKRTNPIDPTGNSELLVKINSYIMPRLDQPLGLKQIAQAIGLSESHLRAQFRSVYGLSLGWHLRRLRLRRAQGLLYVSEIPVKDIAERSGFESVYSFSRAFKSVVGLSPRAYRQKYGHHTPNRQAKLLDRKAPPAKQAR